VGNEGVESSDIQFVKKYFFPNNNKKYQKMKIKTKKTHWFGFFYFCQIPGDIVR
jgi:hypothetical protein